MAEVPTAPNETTVRLQVAGAQNADVGKGVARIAADKLAALGLGHGAIVALHGKRTTAAIAIPPYTADSGLDIVRLDGLANTLCAGGRTSLVGASKRTIRSLDDMISSVGQGRAAGSTIVSPTRH